MALQNDCFCTPTVLSHDSRYVQQIVPAAIYSGDFRITNKLMVKLYIYFCASSSTSLEDPAWIVFGTQLLVFE